MKKGYSAHIEKLTQTNENFRHVLYSADHCQLVLMALLPGEEIGLETHADGDQFFRFEQGQGKVMINDAEYTVTNGDCIIVPAGAQHNVINTSQTESLKLYTIYAPPHHKDGVVYKTKQEATEQGIDFDGETTE